MAKKFIVVCVSLLIACTSLAGCYTTGKAAGKAADKVEEGADAMKKGYEKGKSE
ncbi:MAG: hypothetical protein WAL90_16790 [Desulfobacterales bacterium]